MDIQRCIYQAVSVLVISTASTFGGPLGNQDIQAFLRHDLQPALGLGNWVEGTGAALSKPCGTLGTPQFPKL